jgi:DNA polymerase-3 subunit epsilon
MSELTYCLLRENLSRATCTWKKEWYELLPEGGGTVLYEYEDKMLYRYESPRLTRPVRAVDCSPEQYAAVLARVEELEAKAKAEAEAAKAEAKAKKQQRAGMARNQHAAREADAAEDAPIMIVDSASLLDDFTIIDLEFQSKPSALLELAAIRYKNWQPVGKVVSFVQCRQELNPHVARLTGITRADVFNAPTEKAVLQAFFKLAEGSLLIAHNIAADRTQIEAARARCGATSPLANQWFCTMALAKLRRSKGAACGLGDLCLDFGINAVGAHRALRDVEMTFQVLRHFHQQEPITEVVTSSAKAKPKQASLFAA